MLPVSGLAVSFTIVSARRVFHRRDYVIQKQFAAVC